MAVLRLRAGALTLLVTALAVASTGCGPAAVVGSGALTGTPRPSTSVGPSPVATTAPAGVPDAELRIACDGTHTTIPNPLVRTQPDGVHVRFENTSGTNLSVDWSDGEGNALFGDDIPAAGATLIYTFGPGDLQVACGETPAAFTIVDPDELYASPGTWCAAKGSGATGTTGGTDYAPGATGLTGDVVDIARSQLKGLAADDVVEHAGYPLATGNQFVRVVRDGRTVAAVEYTPDGQGGWLIVGSSSCEGSDIAPKD
jgi:hypothetical protein